MESYEMLEDQMKIISNRCHTVACATGTAALQLALQSFSLPKGSRVIVPAFTQIACARAVTQAGHVPVFADVDNRLLLDPSRLSDEMMEDAAAIMPVHIYGRQCEMNAIHSRSRIHNLRVVEDSAEAHGVNLHPDTDAVCYSFYKNKIIAGEEGGLIGFKDLEFANAARSLRSLGSNHLNNFMHRPGGLSARMSNAHAEEILYGPSSPGRMVANLHLRREIEGWYTLAIQSHDLEHVGLMPTRDVVWLYDVWLFDRRDRVVEELNKQGIQARYGFRSLCRQSEYRNHQRSENLTNTERADDAILLLPVRTDMEQAEVTSIVDTLVDILS